MAMFKLDSKHWRQKPEDVFVLFSWRAHGGVKEVFPQEFMLLIFLFFEKNTCACDPHHHSPFISYFKLARNCGYKVFLGHRKKGWSDLLHVL